MLWASVLGVINFAKSGENLKKVLDYIVLLCNNTLAMSEIREAILKQMHKSGMTIYQVAKLVEGEVPQRTVYAFLTGEKDAKSKTASLILRALGLTITTKSNVKRGRRPRKEV
jgi:hypothetical protein